MNGIKWTNAQVSVTQSAPEARLLVDAGPGTGKTATACARVAWLIEEAGIEPHQILMTSFTNTAVYEIRNRIRSYLRDPDLSAGIRISTLDSFAWNLRAGFHDGEIGFSSYDENIQKAGQLIALDGNAKDYLKTISHFIVDEAQDITGDRSSLVQEVIENLSSQCGVSIFSDEAQAIYGFSEEEGPAYFGLTLPQEIRLDSKFNFTFSNLIDIHRTSDEKLRKLFLDGRSLLQNKAKLDSQVIYKNVRDLILEINHSKKGSAYDMLFKDFDSNQIDSNQFLLFRRRADALQSSHYLGPVPRRIRLSGYPIPIEPWVARCFWDSESEKITESDFKNLASKRLEMSNEEIESKWQLLLQEVGVDKNRINLKKLANILSRPNVPNGFCRPEYGISGPVIGTVHASKGRESEEIVFFMPHDAFIRNTDEERTYERVLEEARILFVGATRAKNTLIISDVKSMAHFRKLVTHYRSQRAFTIKDAKENKVAVEIGMKGDLNAEGLVGQNFFNDKASAILAQKALWNRRELTVPFAGISTKESNWHYAVSIDYLFSDERYSDPLKEKRFEDPIFYLNQNLNKDLFWLGRDYLKRKLKPPQKFRYLYSLGCRTIALSSSDAERDLLHEPWRSSGFVLAPILVGYPDVYLRGYRGGFSDGS